MELIRMLCVSFFEHSGFFTGTSCSSEAPISPKVFSLVPHRPPKVQATPAAASTAGDALPASPAAEADRHRKTRRAYAVEND